MAARTAKTIAELPRSGPAERLASKRSPQRRKRGKARDRRSSEPDGDEGEASRPGDREEAADKCRNALASFKAEPDRIDVAQKRAGSRPEDGRGRPRSISRRQVARRRRRLSGQRRRLCRDQAAESPRPDPCGRCASTLVAPMLPEPIARRLAVPPSLVRISPNGIEPQR